MCLRSPSVVTLLGSPPPGRRRNKPPTGRKPVGVAGDRPGSGASAKLVARLLGAVSLLLLALLSPAVLPGPAVASSSVFAPAPSYPNSTLAIRLAGNPRAGQIVKVVVSGSNAPFEIGYPGSGDYLAYQLDVFAQNGKVLPSCPRAFGEELQNEINLGIGHIAVGLNEGYYGGFGIPLRFRSSRRVRNIVVCAYSRMIEDDAAVSALRFTLRR